MTKKEIQRAFYLRHRAKFLLKAAKYRKKNRSRIRILSARYRAAHRKELRAYGKRWNANPANRMLGLYLGAVKRAKERGISYDIRLRCWLITQPPMICACCRKLLNYEVGRGQNRWDSPSLDRVNNSEGYTLENTRVICFRCNSLKSNATLTELKTITAYVERFERIARLVAERGMTEKAAATVVDAAMFGIGCIEGEVRARIQAQKDKEALEPNGESSARPMEREPHTGDSVLLRVD